jgi:hypothetical protein
VNGITVCCSVVITLWNRLGPSVMNCSNVRGSVVRSCEAYRSSGGEWWHSVWLCCNKVYIHVVVQAVTGNTVSGCVVIKL